MASAFFPEVLFQRIVDNNGKIEDDVMDALELVFRNSGFQPALEIVDDHGVIKYVAKNTNQFVFTVQSKSNNSQPYICYGNYCPCVSYSFKVLSGEAYYCKHLLAARIAEATGRTVLKVVDDVVIRNMLMSK